MAKPNRKNVTREEVVEKYVEHGAPQVVAEAVADDIMAQQEAGTVFIDKEAEQETTNGLTPAEVAEAHVTTAEELIKQYGNKSNAIRALSAEGKTRSEVAKLLGIRYQHVNNVLNQVLKRPIKAQRDAEKLAGEQAGD